jgi:hypothetical protein
MSVVFLSGMSAPAATVDWIRQFGAADGGGLAWGVALDGQRNILVTGTTSGSLGGPAVGRPDAFVSKFDPTGAMQWSRQIGGLRDVSGAAVAADGLGNIYICGQTQEDLGQTHAGGLLDGFVSKFDPAGNLLWTRLQGTNDFDYADGVAADALGNVYVTGSTGGNLASPNSGSTLGGNDAFVVKYNAAGEMIWRRQFGTSRDEGAYAAAVDAAGNLYVGGGTTGSFAGQSNPLGRSDAFLRKYNPDGVEQWTRQFGSSVNEDAFAVSADALGNVFVSGHETISDRIGDAFVSRFDAAGQQYWTKSYDLEAHDTSRGVAADGHGNVYLAGSLHGGSWNLNDNDGRNMAAFVSKYDNDGNLLWTHEVDSAADEMAFAIASDGAGARFIAGVTYGDLAGRVSPGQNAFVAKIVDPQPADFNQDGAVDGADFLAWQRGLGVTHSEPQLSAWREDFGEGAIANTISSQDMSLVPEPAGVSLSLLVLSMRLPSVSRAARTTRTGQRNL